MTMTNTIPNVPRELLEDCLIAARGPINGNLAERLSTLLSAPSPAGVDGLEVRAYERKWSSDNIKPEKMVNENGRKEWPFKFKMIPVTQMPCLPDDEPLCRLSCAQAIIDGLRGEVAQLGNELAETELRALKFYHQIGAHVDLYRELRTERNQQAQRIGELEGLLRACHSALCPFDNKVLEEKIDAALSAGKEGE